MNRRWLAIVALLAVAGAWGATFTMVKGVLSKIAPEPFIFWRFLLAGLILIAFAAYGKQLSRATVRRNVGGPACDGRAIDTFLCRRGGRIVFTAVVTTALAFAGLMWGQAHVTATEAAVLLSFEPVAASLTSVLWDGEPLTSAFLAGATMILAAMIVSQLKPRGSATMRVDGPHPGH